MLFVDWPFLSTHYQKSSLWNVPALNLLLRCSYLTLYLWAKAFLWVAEMKGHAMGVCHSWASLGPSCPRTSPSLWHHSATSTRLAVWSRGRLCLDATATWKGLWGTEGQDRSGWTKRRRYMYFKPGKKAKIEGQEGKADRCFLVPHGLSCLSSFTYCLL